MPRSWRALIASQISSTVSSSSGITIASAPPAMPLKTAIQPVLRPITSITITRSWDCGGGVQAVDRVGRDLHCGVEAEGEVGAGTSLSIVFGTPTSGSPWSSYSRRVIAIVCSPPIATIGVEAVLLRPRPARARRRRLVRYGS